MLKAMGFSVLSGYHYCVCEGDEVQSRTICEVVCCEVMRTSLGFGKRGGLILSFCHFIGFIAASTLAKWH